jgi:hypothetical protein
MMGCVASDIRAEPKDLSQKNFLSLPKETCLMPVISATSLGIFKAEKSES